MLEVGRRLRHGPTYLLPEPPDGYDIVNGQDYETRDHPVVAPANRFAPLASPDGRDHSLVLGADLSGNASVPFTVAAGRSAYLHLATGTATVAGLHVAESDAVTIETPGDYTAASSDAGQLLCFDLPA